MRLQRMLRIFVVVAAAVMICSVAAAATCLGVGTVNVDALRLRQDPNTETEVLLTAYSGDRVIILESAEEEDGTWYKVNCNLTEGWMRGEYLDIEQNMDCELGTGVVNVTLLNFREVPSTDANVIGALAEGAKLSLTGLEDGWFKAEYEGTVGYVSGEYVNFTSAPLQNTFAVTIDGETGEQAQALLSYASSLLGCPYVYGGTSPSGFDCSGFVQYVYKHFDIRLGRSSDDQICDGVPVSEDELQAGDLLFWTDSSSARTTHVGIYIGNRQFIHASCNAGITITSMDSLWYSMRYVGAVRILGVEGYEPGN